MKSDRRMPAGTCFRLFLFTTVISLSVLGASRQNASRASEPADVIKVLIVDGQNKYHPHWPKTTQMMKQYLEETGAFSVDVQRTKYLLNGQMEKDYPLKDGKKYENLDQPKTDPDFAPTFSDYSVVIINSGNQAAPWPEATQRSFESYMKNGGGLVVVHAANNCFPQWKEFNKMIGLGGWGGRNESSGPYVYLDKETKRVRDTSKGKGGAHGKQRQFEVVVREDHPITKGLPAAWLHTQDELYERLRGPGENMTILATGFSNGRTNRHEPLVMTIDYEKGRTFHLALGHADYSFECVGMITLIQRGCEWAATGDVVATAEVPVDFPTRDKSSSRKFQLKEMSNTN